VRVDRSHTEVKIHAGKKKEDRPIRLETEIPRSYTWVAKKLAEDPEIGTKVTRQCIEITEKRIFAKIIDAIIADPDLWDYLEDNYLV
tara:strand:+ start:7607 stop:7867 length:261 start_codon:yes stop_codon:yes gene_type:complete